MHEHVEEVDELGLVRSRPKKKPAAKQMKQRRTNIQKKQYRFKRAIINTPSYLKYFDPSIEAENWLLGIGEMVSYIEQIWIGEAKSPSGCEISQLCSNDQCHKHISRTDSSRSFLCYSNPRGEHAGSDRCHTSPQTFSYF